MTKMLISPAQCLAQSTMDRVESFTNTVKPSKRQLENRNQVIIFVTQCVIINPQATYRGTPCLDPGRPWTVLRKEGNVPVKNAANDTAPSNS